MFELPMKTNTLVQVYLFVFTPLNYYYGNIFEVEKMIRLVDNVFDLIF